MFTPASLILLTLLVVVMMLLVCSVCELDARDRQCRALDKENLSHRAEIVKLGERAAFFERAAVEVISTLAFEREKNRTHREFNDAMLAIGTDGAHTLADDEVQLIDVKAGDEDTREIALRDIEAVHLAAVGELI